MSPRAIDRSKKARSSKAPASSKAAPKSTAKPAPKVAKRPAKPAPKPAPQSSSKGGGKSAKPTVPAAKPSTLKLVPAPPMSKTVVAPPVSKSALVAPKIVTKPAKASKKAKAIPAPRASSRTLLAVPVGNVTVGCAGFPVPATRYFKEFLFVEVQETHVALPGSGTVRRWRREAPAGFSFSMLAPREIGQEGFREGKVVESALKSLIEVGKELDAKAAVFVAPPEFTNSRTNKSAVRDFLQGVKRKFDRVVWEPPPGWDADEASALAEEVGAIAARDPLMHGLTKSPVAYYRLHGPAGHKSRYEDPAIEKLAELAADAKHKEAIYVFTNVDMFADAKRFKKALRL